MRGSTRDDGTGGPWNIVTTPLSDAPDDSKRWADSVGREQFEAMLGFKVDDWQWDWVLHWGRGEELVRDTSKRGTAYKWVKRGD